MFDIVLSMAVLGDTNPTHTRLITGVCTSTFCQRRAKKPTDGAIGSSGSPEMVVHPMKCGRYSGTKKRKRRKINDFGVAQYFEQNNGSFFGTISPGPGTIWDP